MADSGERRALAQGLEALQRGDLEAARTYLQWAVQAAPTDPVPLGHLGALHGRRGEWEPAIGAFRRATELAPASAPLHYNLGLALERGGQPQAALTAYREALTLDPTHSAAQEATRRLEAVENARVSVAVTPPVVAPVSTPVAVPTAAPASLPPAVHPVQSPGEVRVARAVPSSPDSAGTPPLPRVSVPRSVWVALLGILTAVLVCGGIYAVLFFQEYRPASTGQGAIRQPKPVVEVPRTVPTELAALPAGPGIVVCDPVARGVTGGQLDFATGCGRWLQFAAAAQPEFGRTPMWSALEDPAIVLNRPWLRIPPAEVEWVARLTGASHVAVGEVWRENGVLHLTYRVIQADTGRPVGAAVELQGSEAAIRAALPGAARKLCAVLGVAQPKLPPLQEDAVALRAAGAVPIPSKHRGTEAGRKALFAAAQQGPCAAFLLLTHPPDQTLFYLTPAEIEARRRGDLLDPKTRRAVQEHPLVLAAIARATWQDRSSATARELLPTIDRLLQRYPNNYVLHAARVYCLRAAGKYADAIAEGQQAVRCSPKNPDAWRSLGGTYQQWSDQVRGGRFFEKMSAREVRLCQDAYRAWMTTSTHTVSMEPRSFFSHADLSNACTYAGEEELGFEAARKAIQIAPTHPAGYRYLLGMCKPQWYNRPEEAAATLRAAAKVAKKSEWWTPGERVGVATYGAACGQAQLARTLLLDRGEQAELDQWLREEQQHQ